MRNLFFALISFTLVSTYSYSQPCNCFAWVDSTYSIVPMPLGTDTGGAPYYRCNNCSSAPITLPFNFCFYGKTYNTVYINNKGNLSFAGPVYDFSGKGFPAGRDTLMLAALWANVDNRVAPGSAIYYKVTPTHLVVQYYNVGYQTFDDDLSDDFQIIITNGSDSILPEGNNVQFCYYVMRWASADSSGGSGGFLGLPATVGVNKGDGVNYAQFALFDARGYTYYDPWDSTDELYWVNYSSFIFNTCVSGNNLPPIIVDHDSCFNDTVCVGDTLIFSRTFLCSERTQKATLKETVSPHLSGLTSDTSSGGYLYHISNHLVATLADTGTHIITIVATDNSAPPLKDSVQIKVVVTNKCDTSVGINKIANNNYFIVYPNPSEGVFNIMCQTEDIAGAPSILKICNILGEQVLTETIPYGRNEHRVDMSSQPKGLYFVKIYNDNISLGVQKVIIQ